MKFVATVLPIIALVLVGAAIAQASCVVAMLGQDEIAIAADSLVIEGGRRRHECKIHREGPIFFATAGLLRKSETRFRLEPMARSACRRARSVAEAAELLRNTARAPLARAMAYSRSHSPAMYRRDYQGRQSIVTVIFAGFEKGRPQLAMLSFGLDSSGRLSETAENLADGSGSNLIQAGDIEAIRGYEHSRPDWALGMTPLELTKALVQMEVKENRAKVDGPVSILKLYPSGAAWIERGACVDDAPRPRS